MKKYTEVYLQRKQTKCILVESDLNATEQEIEQLAELHINEDLNEIDEFHSAGIGSSYVTENPHQDIPDFKNWPLIK